MTRFRRVSLRARVTLVTIVVLAVGLVASDTVVLLVLRAQLGARVDTQLATAAGVFSRLPAEGLPAAASPGQAFGGPSSELFNDLSIAYLSPDGTIDSSVSSPPRSDVSGPRLPRLDAAAVGALGGQVFDVPDVSGGTKWRVLVVPRTSGTGSVAVATTLSAVRVTVARVSLACTFIGLGVLAVLAAVAWYALRAGLRPLRRIEQTSSAIAAGDLSQRVPEHAAPTTEIGRLSTALNGMLSQIETAFAARADSEARMRRFVADASHELRTPLFGIIGSADLYRMGGLTDQADLDRTMDRIESEALRLARLVEDLLLLAQLDEQQEPYSSTLQLAPMDLRSLAADAIHDLRALDPTRPTRLTGAGGEPVGPAPVLGDEARLRQVISNLIGNVTTHTPAGTPVRIGVGTCDGHAFLEIQDHGPGLTAEQARHVFDRFYRTDTSRSRTTGAGAGLGLAIARSVVTAHGGEIELDTAPGRGATFRIELPALELSPVDGSTGQAV